MAAVTLRRTPTVADVMAAAGRLRAAKQEMGALVAEAEGPVLGEALIQIREAGIDPLEAVFADGLRRFDAAGEYAEDGALRMLDWLRWKCKMSGGAAAERLTVARQLDQLPKTEDAFARGAVSYQQVAVLARTAEHVGADQVRKVEANFLRAAETMDPGQLVGIAKDFEHRVDPKAALDEANRAFERRYLHIGDPVDGLVRIDGLVHSEAGAILRNAVDGQTPPSRDDERTPGQRRVDRLIELIQRATSGKPADGAVNRPHVIIRTSVDTLGKTTGAPSGELEWGGTIPAESVRRLACDAAITRITGLGELEHEITHASRTIPPSTRRALVARDRHCVFPGCARPAPWCEGHHLVFWADGGPTTLENLGLVCGPHHRKVHEDGWKLYRDKDGVWHATPPDARARRNPPPYTRRN